MHKYESLLPRFLSYVKINTRSNENTNKIPSSKEQVNFLNDLKIQLKSIGLEHVRTNESSGYLFATLPSNINKKVKKIGFISHVDTADFNSENVNPQIIEKYDGNSVINLGNGEYKLDPKVFPSLKNIMGKL